MMLCIPLESTCCLFVAYYHEFLNRESYNRLVLSVEKELSKFSIWLIYHEKELSEFVLFIKLLVVTKMKIPKNALERITRHWMRPCLHKSIGGHLLIHFRSGSLWHPLSSSILKNKPIFSLVISKLMPAFSKWLYNFV